MNRYSLILVGIFNGLVAIYALSPYDLGGLVPLVTYAIILKHFL